MKIVAWLTIPLLVGCAGGTEQNAVPERFVDAFYAWDAARLQSIVRNAEGADAALYYQAWAEAGNYQVKQRRPCVPDEDQPNLYHCAITVTDDIGGALGYIATDTFHLRTQDGELVSVKFSSDDPPVLNHVFDWLVANRPEVMAGPCKDMFAGGNTPRDCVRAVVDGARAYVVEQGEAE